MSVLESLVRADSHGQFVVFCPREQWPDLAHELKCDGFEMLADITAVDYLDHPGPPGADHEARFEVVVNLLSLSRNERVRVRIPVDADDPTCPSATPVWPGANFPEREVYDMFGIVFTDHPDLSRILMPEDWEGFPLRKDFGVGAIPVQLTENTRRTS